MNGCVVCVEGVSCEFCPPDKAVQPFGPVSQRPIIDRDPGDETDHIWFAPPKVNGGGCNEGKLRETD